MSGLPEQKVVSASRRTDIPAFYMDWFMGGIEKNAFESVNPYTGQRSIVPVAPGRVHTIVFWSKNFGPFLAGRYGERLLTSGFHLFFNFTLNSEVPLLEPYVPTLTDRLKQLNALCRRFGPECVTWRFDPICWYTTENGMLRDNLADFEKIAAHARDAGIRRCITSFMDDYPKIKKRIKKRGLTASGFAFVDPPMEKKIAVVLHMAQVLEGFGIALLTCCEKALLEALPPGASIRPASCIPSDLLAALFGGRLSMRKDSGQRTRDGCGCRVSVDVGSYRRHPCFHGCLFCYANPV
jgi:hypothetical protein